MIYILKPVRVLLFIFGLTTSVLAVTWFPKEFTCPLDNQKNTFLVVGSYGSYVYQYPSKYQWLFFPVTDSPTYYLCKKCSLATYMWDFDELPKSSLAAIREALKGVTAPKRFNKYTEVPVVERMLIMEKVYSQLNKDDEWWESFYRTKGYHLAKEGRSKEAAEARTRSLEIVQKLLKDEKSESPKKILLYIAGAMNHFTGNDKAAISSLEAALKTAYAEKGASAEDIKNGEAGVNERITEYLKLIKTPGKEPKRTDSRDSHDH